MARTFTSTFAISPHRYLTGRRIDLSRTLLLDGWPVSDVATEAGFYDQAHFTRHFRRHVGTTPAKYGSRRGTGVGLAPC